VRTGETDRLAGLAYRARRGPIQMRPEPDEAHIDKDKETARLGRRRAVVFYHHQQLLT
jgi:hypothetical protein